MKLAGLISAAVGSFVLVVGTSAAPALAGGNGAQKVDLLGPAANAFCDGSGVASGAPGGYGFAVINAPGDGTVQTTVSVKGLDPNTTYHVRLIQGVSDCFSVDTTLTTNGHGNGNAHWSEPSTSDHALVAIGICSQPPCLGSTERWVTQTYFHA